MSLQCCCPLSKEALSYTYKKNNLLFNSRWGVTLGTILLKNQIKGMRKRGRHLCSLIGLSWALSKQLLCFSLWPGKTVTNHWYHIDLLNPQRVGLYVWAFFLLNMTTCWLHGCNDIRDCPRQTNQERRLNSNMNFTWDICSVFFPVQ